MPSLRLFTVMAVAVAVGLATVVSPFASSSPDGLERVAQDRGFADVARTSPIQEGSPVPDYAFPGVESASAATALAGLVGTLVVFALATGLAVLLRRRGPAERPRGGDAAASPG